MFASVPFTTLCLALTMLPHLVVGQLSGPVGPSTTIAQKRAVKVCNVLDYGAKADNTTDLGAPLTKAWSACLAGGLIIIPSGEYQMATPATLNRGSGIAIQLDGVIYRSAKYGNGGNMIAISNMNDFEMFSSRGQGAIQGFGYQYRLKDATGPRLLRLNSISNFALHDFVLTDSPVFHLVLAGCSNGEVYNMAIRGGNQGGLDGVDVWGNNIHIHDVMVTNRDECVTTKSPSSNILIEQVYCNWSGGSALGSFAMDTNVSNIHYRNIYNVQTNQMMLIKSYGGNGTVKNVKFENFIGHNTAYSLWVTAAWSGQPPAGGPGIDLHNVTVSHWRGDTVDGTKRGPISIWCSSDTPCTDVNINDFAIWTNSGKSEISSCQNVYGSGACIKSGTGGSYSTITQTISSPPSDYAAPYMPYDLTAAFSPTAYIPIPFIPSYFYPGTTPLKPLAKVANSLGLTCQ